MSQNMKEIIDTKNETSAPVKRVHMKMPDVRRWVNSPWIFLAIPVLVGGLWLVNNTWVITDNLDKPYALLVGPIAVASVVVGWLIFTFFRTIQAACRAAWQALNVARKENGTAQFFWFVLIVFMVVSILEAGPFFSDLEHGALFGVLGYVTAFAIDLIAIICMRARLEALRLYDHVGSWFYLLGVVVCSGLSAYGNTVSSLTNYRPVGNGVPEVMNTLTPWFGMAFPLLILFLSIAADYMVDHTSTKLDADVYRTQEQKRLDVLTVRREMREKTVAIEEQIAQMYRKQKAARGAVREREWFFINWFFPRKPLDMQSVIEGVVAQMQPQVNAQFAAMTQRLDDMTRQAQRASEELGKAIETQIAQVYTQRDIDNTLIAEQYAATMQALAQHQAELNGNIQRTYRQIHLDTAEKLADRDARFASVMETVTGQLSGLHSVAQHVDDLRNMAAGMSEELSRITAAQQVMQEARIEEGNEEELEKIPPTQANENEENDGKDIEYLSAYPIFLSALTTGAKSMTIEEVVLSTLHSRKMVMNRVKDGTLRRTKNPNKVTVDSVIKWLKDAPLPARKETAKQDDMDPDSETIFEEKQDRNTDELVADIEEEIAPDTEENEVVSPISNGHSKETVKLDDLVEMTV